MAIRQSTAVVFSDLWITMLLNQLIAAAPTIETLDGGTLALFISDLNPTPATELATFEALHPVFTGYAPVVVGTPLITGVGTAIKAIFGSAVFQRTGGTDAPTATGWWFVDSNGALVASGRFSEPVSFSSVGALLDFSMFLPLNEVTTVADQT